MNESDLLRQLRAAREACGATQADVAEALNQTPMKVSYLESGQRALRVRDACAYADALGMELVIELRARAGDSRHADLVERASRALAALPPDQREMEVRLL